MSAPLKNRSGYDRLLISSMRTDMGPDGSLLGLPAYKMRTDETTEHFAKRLVNALGHNDSEWK